MAETRESETKAPARNVREILQEERYLWMARAIVLSSISTIIPPIISGSTVYSGTTFLFGNSK